MGRYGGGRGAALGDTWGLHGGTLGPRSTNRSCGWVGTPTPGIKIKIPEKIMKKSKIYTRPAAAVPPAAVPWRRGPGGPRGGPWGPMGPRGAYETSEKHRNKTEKH